MDNLELKSSLESNTEFKKDMVINNTGKVELFESKNLKCSYMFVNDILIEKSIYTEEDIPTTYKYYKSGKINIEIYKKNNLNHRENNPAFIVYDEEGNITEQKYFIKGKEYLLDIYKLELDDDVIKIKDKDKNIYRIICDKGYEELIYESNKLKVKSFYNFEELLHSNDDKPARISYLNDEMIVEEYFKNGLLHREEDLPSVVVYYNGKIKLEKYYKNNKIHRLQKPAIVMYKDNLENVIEVEQYYKNNFLHNSSGPSVIKYHKNKVYIERYFLDNVFVTKDKWEIEKLKYE